MTLTVHEEKGSEDAETNLGFEDGFDFGIGVEKFDNHGFPSARCGHVEEEEYCHFQDEDEEEECVGHLKHKYLILYTILTS